MTCWRRLRDWQAAGVWDALHEVPLAELHAAGEIDWSRAVADGSHVRAKGGCRDGTKPGRPRPAGWALTVLFARRLAQLALPLRPLEVAGGIDSRVVRVVDDTRTVLGTAWLRTLRATGQVLYSGWYGVVMLPGCLQPSIRVVFPLPNGNLTVLLRPEVTGEGDLRLVSPLGRFGAEGAYLVVRGGDPGRAWVRRVLIVERFDVYVDADGVLRCNHDLRLWQLPVLRLHDRLDRLDGGKR